MIDRVTSYRLLEYIYSATTVPRPVTLPLLKDYPIKVF